MIEPQYERTDLGVNAGWFQSPAISPNGRDLAYVSRNPQGFALRVRAVNGSTDRLISMGSGEAYFAFSRDGRRIAYLEATRTAPVPLGRLSIFDLSDNGSQSIVREGPVLAFFWAPNGRQLAFMIPETGSDVDPLFLRGENVLTIRLMGWEAKTGRTWTIARFPISGGFMSILPFFDQYHRSATIWSPDSRSLVFTAYAADGTSGLFVARADGRGRPRFLVSGDFAFWSWR
jgi:Tol biopolymer transport system component